MTNVVEFPPRASPPSHGSEDRAERAEVLRRRVADRPALSPSDQEQIARNLFRTLAQLEQDGRLRRADLCREAFGSTPEESTKRLRQYTLDPDKEGAAREKALTALAKKATIYLKLAEQAARMVGDDPDAAILALVHGTTLVQDASVEAIDPLTRDLRAPVFRALERMTDAIARRTDLHRTFRLMARYPTRERDRWDDGSPDLPDDATAVPAGPVNDVLPILEDGAATPEDAESARGWLRLALGAPAVLVGESVLHEASQELGPQHIASINGAEPFEPDPRITWSATIAFRLQVWLGILPFGEAHEPRPGLRLVVVRQASVAYADHESGLSGPGLHTRRSQFCEHLFIPMDGEGHWWLLSPDHSPIQAHLSDVLGRQIHRDDEWMVGERVARVLALGSSLAQQSLDRHDCGTISDWVGPLPAVLYDENGRAIATGVGARDELEPGGPTEYADHLHRYRFRHLDTDSAQHERHVQGWSAGTLGYKLERSLLEIEGDDSVASQLEAQARALTERVQHDIGEALRRREARLSRLGRGEA